MTNVSDLCGGHMDVFSLLVHRHVDLMKKNELFEPLGGGYDSSRCTHKAGMNGHHTKRPWGSLRTPRRPGAQSTTEATRRAPRLTRFTSNPNENFTYDPKLI